MPVGQSALLHPVGRAAVYLCGKFKQEGLACAVVEPDDGEQVVAATRVLPIVAQEFLVGVLELPLVVGGEDGQDALVAAPLVVVLQDLQRKHVGPKFASAILVLVDGAEETVRLTAAQNAFYPELRLVEHRLVIQDVGKVGIASEPVRHFLPAVTAAWLQPGIAFLVEPVADFAKLSAQAVLLPQEHFANPAAGRDRCGRQLDERIVGQGSTVVDIERGCRFNVAGLHHLCLLSHEWQMEQQSCHEESFFYVHSVNSVYLGCKGTTFFIKKQVQAPILLTRDP